MKIKIIILILLICATFPVWQWYVSRLTDGSDEPWGAISLVTMLAMAVLSDKQQAADVKRPSLLAAALLILFYAVTASFFAPLFRAAIVMTVVSLLLSRLCMNRNFDLALWGLAMLSLPLIASLQFYFGYPLRFVVSFLTTPMLNLAGYAVEHAGASIMYDGEMIMVDAPCSGIKMLWAGGFLMCTLACMRRLTNRRTLLVGIATFITILFANAVRVSALFFTEADILQLPGWTHNAIGIAVFAMAAVAIIFILQYFGNVKCRKA